MKKFFILFFLIFLDISSKQLIFYYIDLNSFIPIFFFIELTHIHNFGVSFGLLSGLVSPWILILIGLLIIIFIFYLMIGAEDKIEKFALLIIIGGALSNVIDRMINGYVIDFIYLHYDDFYWPAFNFADIYITIGIMMILVNIISKQKFSK